MILPVLVAAATTPAMATPPPRRRGIKLPQTFHLIYHLILYTNLAYPFT